MVVFEDRLKAARSLAAYLRGEIDNFALDEALLGYSGPDQTINRIARELWFTYDDIRSHRVKLDRRGWQGYRRCIAFLLTSLELPEKRRHDIGDPVFWPFRSRIQLFRARPDLSMFGIPKFNPSIHNPPLPRWEKIAIIAILTAIGAFIGYLVLRGMIG